MHKTTPNDGDSFGDFVERERKAAAEAKGQPDEDLDDAWDQYDEEQAAEKANRNGCDSTDWKDIDWSKEFASSNPAKEDDSTPEPQPVAEDVKEAARASGKIDRSRQERRLTEQCRGYKVNDALANCREISDKFRCTLAIINGLMSNLGYCYASVDQLAIYMHMSVRGAHNLLAKLRKLGFIIHIGWSGQNIKRVVRSDLSNNPQRTQKLIDEYNKGRQ